MAILNSGVFFAGVLAAADLLLPVAAHAAPCPWLNVATARGVLGGEVKLQVSNSAAKGGEATDISCAFSREDGVATLAVAIHTLGDAKGHKVEMEHCGGSVEVLRGVGNEAIACSDRDSSGNISLSAVGRVRDRSFVIRWRQASLPGERTDAQRDRAILQNVAEQVAGSMF